jgi:hypothetical protein
MQNVEGSLKPEDDAQRSVRASDPEQREDYGGDLQEVEVGQAAGVDEALFEPVVVCDVPKEESVVTRGTVVKGWAYSPVGIREVSVWLGGQRVGEAKLGLKRPGVTRAHPEWVGALRSGFRYRFDVVPTSAQEERRVLVIVAEDKRGRRAEVRRVVRRDPGQWLKEQLKSKKQELRRTKNELAEINGEESAQRIKRQRKKRQRSILEQEVFQLQRELRAAEQERAEEQSQAGALPDFILIGAKRCGQSTLYKLLIQHPHVEPASSQELHFFDMHFDLGVEWYRRCFPTPRFKEGRETITGEGTPGYLQNEYVPERVKKVVPQARLIALLRNPVHRIYADYRKKEGKGRESRTFKEIIDQMIESTRCGERDEVLEGEYRVNSSGEIDIFLHRGIYVDHLMRWREFFPREQILVLKSEDFFENPQEILNVILDFLDLPNWEPEDSLLQEIRDGAEEARLHPETKRRLEEYFKPHNNRLYEYLGRDFGW